MMNDAPQPLCVADAEWISELHGISFPKRWSAQEFTELLNAGAIGWGTGHGAFVLLRPVASEAEILTLATHPQQRRNGLAYRLMQHAIASLAQQGGESLFLEVRADNLPAQALYAALGFTQIGRRAGYYGLPDGTRQDALTLHKQIQPNAASSL